MGIKWNIISLKGDGHAEVQRHGFYHRYSPCQSMTLHSNPHWQSFHHLRRWRWRLEGIGTGGGLSSSLSPVAMRTERLQPGYQGALCTSYHQVMSDGAAASCSQERGWVVGGVGEQRGKGAQEKQIGMFPEETGSTKKRKRRGRSKEQMSLKQWFLICLTGVPQADLPRCDDSEVKNESNKDSNNMWQWSYFHSSSFVINKCTWLIRTFLFFNQTSSEHFKHATCFLLWYHVLLSQARWDHEHWAMDKCLHKESKLRRSVKAGAGWWKGQRSVGLPPLLLLACLVL